VDSPLGLRSAVPAAVQHEVQGAEPGPRNEVPAAVQRAEEDEELGQRNELPVAVQREGLGQRNGVRAVQREARERHEEQ
jgi:hypothetical protein